MCIIPAGIMLQTRMLQALRGFGRHQGELLYDARHFASHRIAPGNLQPGDRPAGHYHDNMAKVFA